MTVVTATNTASFTATPASLKALSLDLLRDEIASLRENVDPADLYPNTVWRAFTPEGRWYSWLQAMEANLADGTPLRGQAKEALVTLYLLARTRCPGSSLFGMLHGQLAKLGRARLTSEWDRLEARKVLPADLGVMVIS